VIHIRKYGLYVAFAVSFLSIGIPYWQIPYSSVSLPSTLYGLGLVTMGVAAFGLSLLRIAKLTNVILVLGAAAPAAVCARVCVETAIDPTSHNLWPFEVVIALLVGVICASIGAAVGALIAGLSAPRRA
jgi:hypothetical protein